MTYRGKPVAVLVPIDDPYATASLPPVSPQSPWDELTRLGQKLAEGWPEGVSSADVLAEMRR